ncbi:MAG: cell division protein ZapA [Firmicutes bacterium]|nr:cell division protein ZapA [Bacillota bacterium]
MQKETVIQVELDGQTYVLRGSGDEEILHSSATLVAQKIAAIRVRCPNYSTTRAAMLAALQIAEEMLVLKEEYRDMLNAADIFP